MLQLIIFSFIIIIIYSIILLLCYVLRDKTEKPKTAGENDKNEKINIMDKPPTPILDSKDNHLEPTSSLTSNSSGYFNILCF